MYKTPSPRYPQNNRFTERMVATVKNALQKSMATQQDLSLALLCLRTMPVSGRLPSSSELLFGRQIMSTLPTVLKHTARTEYVKDELQQGQVTRKRFHDHCETNELPPLMADDHVMV